MSKEKRKRCKISKLFRLYVSFSEGVFPAFLSFFNPYLWEVPLSWIVPSHHRSQECITGVLQRSITEDTGSRRNGTQVQHHVSAQVKGLISKDVTWPKSFWYFWPSEPLHPMHFLGGKGRRMTSCGRNESPQFSFPPSLLLHGEKYQHKCYCGRRGWVALPNPMEVLAGSIVRTSLRWMSSMITTTSGFPRHVCGARVFYMFSYGREKEITFRTEWCYWLGSWRGTLPDSSRILLFYPAKSLKKMKFPLTRNSDFFCEMEWAVPSKPLFLQLFCTRRKGITAGGEALRMCSSD